MSELFDIRNTNGAWEVLTSVQIPGDPIYKRDPLGIQNFVGHEERKETWEPLATWLADHRVLTWPDGTLIDGDMTMAEALTAEGWLRPEREWLE